MDNTPTTQNKATQAFDAPEIHFIKKALKPDTKMVVTTDPILMEDEFQSLYFTPKKNTNVIVEPPFNPLQLASLIHRNNILAQCVAAMEVNIDGSGYAFELLDAEKDEVTGDDPSIDQTGEKPNVNAKTPAKDDNPSGLPQHITKFAPPQAPMKPNGPQKPMAPQKPNGAQQQPDPAAPPQKAQTPSKNGANTGAEDSDTPQNEEVDKEKEMLEHFFKEPFPGMSFTTIRRKLRIDMEATGNGYLEVIRNLAGEVVFIRHLESVAMRLVKLDAPTNVEVSVVRGGKEVKATLPMRERRFAYKIGAHLVYYREFGSSRQVNKKNGSWIDVDSQDNKNPDVLGSEVLHFTVIKDFRTHYGLPRWINQLPSILGSRKAEEFNLEFFDAGGLPPAIIFVQGGALVGGVKEQLQQYLSGKASQKHRAAIVEVMSTSGSLDSAGSVTVKTERFGASLQDAMFQKYDENCNDHIRKSFRLPGILVGNTLDYNRATSEAALQAAENQVFQPERFHFDEVINTTVIKALGAKKYIMRSKNMTLSNPDLQLRGVQAAWNLIEGEDFVDRINEIAGLDMTYSKEAEEANKPPAAPAGGMPPPDGGDAGDSPDMGATPGQDDGSGQNYDMTSRGGRTSAGGDPRQFAGQDTTPNQGVEMGQAPGGAGQGQTLAMKSERMSPSDIVKLVNEWSIIMGLAIGEKLSQPEVILYKVDNLQDEDRKLFDGVLVKKMFKGADPDAVELVHSCDHDDL